jgi:hypothetical protein
MVGDTSQALAVSLSRLYSSAGRHDEAIAACRRVIDERAADVSPYKLAETWISSPGPTGARATTPAPSR